MKNLEKKIGSQYQDITSESEEDIEREHNSRAVFTENTQNANVTNSSNDFEDNEMEQEDQIEIESGHEQTLYDLTQSVWGPPEGKHLEFDENFENGVHQEWQAALVRNHPIDYFFAFGIIDAIVDQTNIYATQFVMNNNNISNKSRVQNWEPTTRAEIITFDRSYLTWEWFV